jgi:lysophospholipase L1-like esterase
VIRWVLACLVAATLPLVAPVATAARADQPPLRVLLVGDSVTQGSVGDWTWRYRLWKRFQDAGVAVDLVGPHQGLYDVATDEQVEGGYLDPAFDTDHAARWGMSFTAMETPIGELVAAYHPDVVVELLGVNDLIYGQSPAAVEADLRGFVADARAADPAVDVVLGAIPQRWVQGVASVDDALPAIAAELDTPGARVVASDVGAGFGPEDVWDGGHPSATGEMKVAVSVAAALDRIGVPVAFPDPPPTVENGPIAGAELRVTSGDGSATLDWTQPLGATHEYLWMRDATVGQDWIRLFFPVTGTSWTAGDLTNGHRYEFRLQPTKGTAVAQHVFSNVVTAWPALAPPSAPPSIDLAAVDHGLVVSWAAAERATRYRLRWWPVDDPSDADSAETEGLTWTVAGLVAGRRYAVSVEPLADWVPGPQVTAVGAPLGPVPAAVRPTARVDRLSRVHLRWAPVEHATSYVVAGAVTLATHWRSQPLAPGRHLLRIRARAEDVAGPVTVVRVRIR